MVCAAGAQDVRLGRAANRVPLLGHASRPRVLLGGHQQHLESRRGAEHLRPIGHGSHHRCHAPREPAAGPAVGQDGAVRAVPQARSGEHPHLPCNVADRRGVPLAAAHVPFAGQLLHARLVHGMARRGASIGCARGVLDGVFCQWRADRGRRRGREQVNADQELDRAHGDVHSPVGLDRVEAVPGRRAAAQSRHAHVLPRAARDLQSAARCAPHGAGHGQAEAHRRPRQAADDREGGEAAAGHAREEPAGADQDDQRGRGDDGLHLCRQGRPSHIVGCRLRARCAVPGWGNLQVQSCRSW